MATRGIVGACLLAATLLTGCSEHRDEAGGLPQPSSPRPAPSPAASSASASPTATATAQSTEATLRASAEKFVRDYFRTFNAVSHDHQFQKLERYYVATCSGCIKDLEYVRDEARRGLRAVGNDYELLYVRARSASGTAAYVDVVSRANRGELLNSAGQSVEGLKGWESIHGLVRLVRKDGGWKVGDLEWGR